MPTIKLANWQVSYLGSTDGSMRLGKCDYAGVLAVHSAAVPFVYVNYVGDSSGPFADTLTCEAPVEVREIMNGFDLKARYNFGDDYLYDHVCRFHDDGQFGSTIVVQGPGEEIYGRHTYHLPFRFDLDISGSSGDSFRRRSAVNGQGIEDTNIVVWYIAHLSALDRVAACAPWIRLDGYPRIGPDM